MVGKMTSEVKGSHYPSGRYRRTIRGIFFSRNSLIAICRGSVSPSRSTRTGAFMLCHRQHIFHPFLEFSPLLPPGITHLICSARVPRIRARSYLVMKGVVVRWSFGIFLSLCDLSLPLPWLAAALGSPETMTWSWSPCSPSWSAWRTASSSSAGSGSGS